MPAVTVSDITVLPRVPEPGPDAVARPVTSLTTAPTGYEGEGFPVRRAFAGVDLRDLDPSIHLDQGTPWHSRRGVETVTYLLDGTFEQHDSHGDGTGARA